MSRLIQSRLFQYSILIFFAGFLFILFFIPIEVEDVWWHLATGRWIFNQAQVPHLDPFAFSNEKTPWLCYHWLGSSVLYAIYQKAGFLGLKIFRALFLVGVLGIFYRYAKKHVPLYILLSLILCMALAISRRFFLKPDLFNFIFIQIFLMQLIAYQEHHNIKKLLVLPLIGILWFNLHLGCFVYGSALIVVFLLAASCYKQFKQAKELLIVLLLFWLGFIVNPYGVEGLLYPFQTFFSSHSSGFYNVNSVVQDLLPATYLLSSWQYLYFHLLILASISALLFIKQHRLTYIILWLVALLAFLCVTRNSIFFVFVSAYVIVQAFKDNEFKKQWMGVINVILCTVVLIVALVQINIIVRKKILFEGKFQPYLTVSIDPLQDSLMTFLVKHQINGPMFNAQPIGGELAWFAYPQIRYFIDGRFVLGVDRLNVYEAICMHPNKEWSQAIKQYGFKSVVMDISNDQQLNFILYLNQQPDWQLIWVKGSWVVYVLKESFPEFEDNLFNLKSELKASDISAGDIQQLQELVKNQKAPIKDIIDLDSLSTSATLMNLGFPKAGIKQLIESLKLNPQAMSYWAGQEILKQFKAN